jgi:hypothetical protein
MRRTERLYKGLRPIFFAENMLGSAVSGATFREKHDSELVLHKLRKLKGIGLLLC